MMNAMPPLHVLADGLPAMNVLVASLLPEMVMLAGAAAVLFVGLARNPAVSSAVFRFSVLTVLAALVAAWRSSRGDGPAMPFLHDDSLVWYARLITLGVGLLILLANRHVPETTERGEFFSLLLCSLTGILLVVKANDLVLLFLALELVSVPTYILVGLSRSDIRAQEATGKYFFLGAFAAALMLYGFSFLYGVAGTTTLFGADAGGRSIAAALFRTGAMDDPLTVVGLLLALGGLAFKIAAVPLHFYVPDVYQGAASPITGMLGFVPKFAGLLAIIRLLSLSGWGYGDSLFWALWVIAAVTMFVGNTLALMQQNVKRMLAYSSIAHSGYMLVGIVAGPGAPGLALRSPMRDGLSAILFYIAIYGVMNLGAFAALSFFRKPGAGKEESAETLDDLAGAARRHPWAALGLAVCVLSLMGLPPTGGFLGKLYLFSAAVSAAEGTARYGPMIWLVIIGVLNSAIAAAYYLRIVASCYLRTPVEQVAPSPCIALRACVALCAAGVLAVFFRPSVLLDSSHAAVVDVPRTAPAQPVDSTFTGEAAPP